MRLLTSSNWVTLVLVAGAITTLFLLSDHFLTTPGDSEQSNTVTEQEWEALRTEGYRIGEENDQVQVVLFADMDCPFSAEAYHYLMDELEQRDGKVALLYRHLTWIDESSRGFEAGQAAQCAAKQGDFFASFVNAAYTYRSIYESRNWTQLAERAGLQKKPFEDCLSARRDSARVARDIQQAHDLGFMMTPTIVVQGNVYEGADALPAVGELITAQLE